MTQTVQVLSGGVVVNAFVVDPAATLSGGVLTLPGGNVMPVPAGCSFMMQAGAGIGWTLSGGTLVPPIPTAVTMTKSQLQSYADGTVMGLLSAERNYTITTGVTVKADAGANTSAFLSGLATWGAASPSATTQWTDKENDVTTITGTQAQALAIAVATYAQSVRALAGTVALAITAGSITTTAQIDTEAWPT